MKKILGILLSLIVLFGLTACSVNNAPPDGDGTQTINPGDDPADTASDTLVAYFSCTNNTKAIAQLIANETKGELYEITPEVPYTEEDLDYYSDDCRANREQADKNARPAISGSVQDMDKYSIIYIGYPIWQLEAPRIISTFLESYDFDGKTIVPFCTSHSSSIGESDIQLRPLASSATWIAGRRFLAGTSQKLISEWIESLDLKSSSDSPARRVKA